MFLIRKDGPFPGKFAKSGHAATSRPLRRDLSVFKNSLMNIIRVGVQEVVATAIREYNGADRGTCVKKITLSFAKCFFFCEKLR